MTTYMQKEYEAALELDERPVLNEVEISPLENRLSYSSSFRPSPNSPPCIF
jgi:hypothetical protein